MKLVKNSYLLMSIIAAISIFIGTYFSQNVEAALFESPVSPASPVEPTGTPPSRRGDKEVDDDREAEPGPDRRMIRGPVRRPVPPF